MLPSMGFDLDQYRTTHGLTLEQLGELIEVGSESQVRRYCIGEVMPRDEVLERILRLDGVDLYALHQRRMAWLRANRPRRLAGDVGADDDSPSDTAAA